MPQTGQPSRPEHIGLPQLFAQSSAFEPPPPSLPLLSSSSPPGVERDEGPHATATSNTSTADFSMGSLACPGRYKNIWQTQHSKPLPLANIDRGVRITLRTGRVTDL